jgi:hypothetical protein
MVQSAYGGDAVRGKKLHDEHCVKCHTSIMGGNPTAIFTRENSRIASYSELYQQVNQCRQRLNVEWPDQNVEDVVEYLNQTFYKFKK